MISLLGARYERPYIPPNGRAPCRHVQSSVFARRGKPSLSRWTHHLPTPLSPLSPLSPHPPRLPL
ncbi:MAG: hypothetical protein KME31_02570 [Tolypothrix carrinoi HA7290-LM1]|nr:hypothetical protein [Tolypothrix carrinoi HA7290-LM1]